MYSSSKGESACGVFPITKNRVSLLYFIIFYDVALLLLLYNIPILPHVNNNYANYDNYVQR